jgi:hypothetical protein
LHALLTCWEVLPYVSQQEWALAWTLEAWKIDWEVKKRSEYMKKASSAGWLHELTPCRRHGVEINALVEFEILADRQDFQPFRAAMTNFIKTCHIFIILALKW